MKNVPIHYARTLIIARIAATIIPTPIDFNNLIIIIRGFRSRICLFHSVCLFMNFILYHKEKQKIRNKSKHHCFLTYYSPENQETKKKAKIKFHAFFCFLMISDYHFCPLYSSETVSFFLPFARRAANTLRPLADAILSRKPCLFFLFLLEG